MVDSPDETPTANEPVSLTTMTLVMVHPSGLQPAEMNYHDLAAHLTGDFVAARTSTRTDEIADDQVDAEIEALGGAPGYFRRQPLGIETRRDR
jgi:hypothetical protein